MRTQFVALVLAGIGFSTSLALADSSMAARGQAEAALAKARNDYFNALISGPPKTSQQADAIRNSTVAPASVRLNQVIYSQWNQAFENQFRKPESVDPSSSPPRWAHLGSIFSGTESAAPASASDSVDAGAGDSAAPPVHPAKKGYTLNGQGVPRVLEFKGK